MAVEDMVTDGVSLCLEVSHSRKNETTWLGATSYAFAANKHILDRALVERESGIGAVVPYFGATRAVTQLATRLNSTQVMVAEDKQMLEVMMAGGDSKAKVSVPCSGAAPFEILFRA